MIDRTDVFALTVTQMNGFRETSLFATMSNILANVTNLNWVVAVQSNGDKVYTFYTNILDRLAEINNNKIYWVIHPNNFSVARSVAEVLNRHKPTEKHIWFIDDDIIIPHKTIEILQQCLHNEHITTGCVYDVKNVYGYNDWFEKPLSTKHYDQHLKEFGINSSAHQLWRNEIFLVRSDYISPTGRQVPLKYFTTEILDTLIDWPKGLRGFDLFLQQAFLRKGIQFYLIIGADMFHIGVEKKDLNWDGVSEHYKTHVDTKRIVSGQTVNRITIDEFKRM